MSSVDEQKEEIMNKIEDSLILYLIKYFNDFSSLWALSRTNKYLYKLLNKKMISIFKNTFEKKIIDKACCLDILEHVKKLDLYIFSGSFIWSILLGEEWEFQDIDIFCKSNDKNNLIMRKLEPHIYDNFPLMKMKYCGLDYDGVNGILDVWSVYNQGMKFLEFIMVEYPNSFTEQFDVDGCKSWYDGTYLFVQDPINTLFKVSNYQPDKDVQFRGGNYSIHTYKGKCPQTVRERNIRRFDKYISRGIELILDGQRYKKDDNERSELLSSIAL